MLSRLPSSRLSATVGLLAACLCLPVHAIDNPRRITFDGQPIPAVTVPPSAATVSNGNGTMLVNPLRSTLGLLFHPTVSYGVANSNMAGQGTQFDITPAANAIPYRLMVQDQRNSSYQYIYADCMNQTTQAIETCDLLNNQTQFPRTNLPPSGSPYTQLPVVSDGGGGWLLVTTPGNGLQSNGLYIDLPPTVRKVYFYTVNYANQQDFISGSVLVADAPSVSKTFAPTSVTPGNNSTLTITVKGPGFGGGNGGTAGPVPGLNLTDVLPAPLTVASASTTCTGGTLTAASGSNTISLTNATLPNDGCTVTVDVQWPGSAAGISACQATPRVTNTITAPSQFSTAVGQMDAPATADLDCTYVAPPVQNANPVPMLGSGALLATSLGLLGLGSWRSRKRRRH